MKNPLEENQTFKAELFYITNADGVKEYIIHCTSLYNDTGVTENGFLVDVVAEENTLELTLLTTMSHKSPSLEADTYIHHTIELGAMPSGHEEGIVKVYSMATGGKGGGFAKTDKKPQGEVRTASAKEKI